jgi:hypothetical protein
MQRRGHARSMRAVNSAIDPRTEMRIDGDVGPDEAVLKHQEAMAGMEEFTIEVEED